jgi:hypothetical protein
MVSERLDSGQAEALLRRQRELQAEAERVVAELDLLPSLRRAGEVRLIGSAVSGLMAWRDLDLQVLSPGLDAAGAWDAMRPLAAHRGVYEARYLDQSGARSLAGAPRNSRHYFQVFYRAAPGADWKLDISFWLSDDPREDEVAYLEGLARRQDPETRLAILWIKSLWAQSPDVRDPAYAREVSSLDLYEAVLEHGVRTPEAFDAYLTARGKPARTLGRG